MTEVQKKKIVTLWLEGMSIQQIGQMLPVKGIEYRATVKEMKENGEFPTERKSTQEKIKEAFDNGMTNPYEIAETYGLSVNYVRNAKVFLKLNNKRPSHNYKPRKKDEKTGQIKAEITLGKKSLSEIARDYGISRQRVHQLKKEMEI